MKKILKLLGWFTGLLAVISVIISLLERVETGFAGSTLEDIEEERPEIGW